jgi:peptide/nickel transport system substrate-binding protein
MTCTTRTRAQRRPAICVGLAATLLASTALAQDAATLRFGAINEPTSLSLHQDVSGATFIPLQALYEPLLRIDSEMNLQPGLAVSWEQLDETTYRIGLRDGVRFHSGNPLNAEAVKSYFTWQIRPEEPGNAYAYLNPIAEMVVQDELTLDIRLNEPYGPFLYHLTMPHTSISDMRQYEALGAQEMIEQPSGTGPFKLERWDLGSEVVLAANPDYWGGAPAVERIQFRFIPEAAARGIALETGEIDIAETVSVADLPRLEQNPEISVIEEFEFRTILWIVNSHHPVLSDLRVRKALAHAIDYELVFESIVGAAARPLTGFLPEGTFGYVELGYEHDPDLAAELLAQAGWSRGGQGFWEKDGERLGFTHVSGNHVTHELDVAEGVQTLLREFGVEMEIQVLERAVHTSVMFDHARDYGSGKVPDFATTQWDHGIRTGDASVALDPIFTCGGARNFGHFCNPDYDDLIAFAVSGAPENERLDAYRGAQELLHEAVVALPMWQPRMTMAYRDSVTEVALMPTRVLYFDQLRLER